MAKRHFDTSRIATRFKVIVAMSLLTSISCISESYASQTPVAESGDLSIQEVEAAIQPNYMERFHNLDLWTNLQTRQWFPDPEIIKVSRSNKFARREECRVYPFLVELYYTEAGGNRHLGRAVAGRNDDGSVTVIPEELHPCSRRNSDLEN
jgi:hypothetical protein